MLRRRHARNLRGLSRKEVDCRYCVSRSSTQWTIATRPKNGMTRPDESRGSTIRKDREGNRPEVCPKKFISRNLSTKSTQRWVFFGALCYYLSMDIFDGPDVFTKNEEIYKAFIYKTIPHSRGFFVLAPSGTGKTYFVVNQKENHWIDGDTLWTATGAHPNTDWWAKGLEIIKEVDARSDVITAEARRLGLWIMGASNNWLTPDAVVIPPLEVNTQYIKKREQTNYDGGLKTDQLAQLESHRKEIEEMAKNKSVPIFESIEEATSHLENIYNEF
jgi:hypothetical protein